MKHGRTLRLALMVAVLALALPVPEALACPSCAGKDSIGAAYLAAMAAMILFPFAVVGTVATYVKRSSRS